MNLSFKSIQSPFLYFLCFLMNIFSILYVGQLWINMCCQTAIVVSTVLVFERLLSQINPAICGLTTVRPVPLLCWIDSRKSPDFPGSMLSCRRSDSSPPPGRQSGRIPE